MIDAVNIVGVAPLMGTRSVAGESSVISSDSRVNFADSFFSTRIRMDNFLDLAIIEIRSSETGDVIRQFPTEKQIEAFKRSEAATEKDRMLQNDKTAQRTNSHEGEGYKPVNNTDSGTFANSDVYSSPNIEVGGFSTGETSNSTSSVIV